MKVLELADKLKHYIDNGTIDVNTDVEFLIGNEEWPSGLAICNILLVQDGNHNQKLFLTDLEKVI